MPFPPGDSVGGAPTPARLPTPATACDVVIVDDEDGMRALLQVFLETAGYSLVTFDHGSAAIGYLRTHVVRVVVTDVYMPECDGIEVMRAVAREHPGVRLIAMTGSDVMDLATLRQMVRCLGARHLLIKPFRLCEILAALRDEIGDPRG